MKRTPFLLMLGILAIVIVGGYTGYTYWQQSVVDADLKKVERTLAGLEEKALQFKNQDILEAINAKTALPEIRMESIKWSQVIEDIQRAIPRSGGKAIVQILSYSGSAGSNISLNVKTNPGSTDPYFDVADLIEAFDDDSKFVDTFVPSISSGNDDEGREVLSFVLSADYVEEDPLDLVGNSADANLENTVGEILNESLDESPAAPVIR